MIHCASLLSLPCFDLKLYEVELREESLERSEPADNFDGVANWPSVRKWLHLEQEAREYFERRLMLTGRGKVDWLTYWNWSDTQRQKALQEAA